MSDEGKLFVLEGPDGVGKTTIAAQLAARFCETGTPCDHLAFPGNEEGSLGSLVYRLHHERESVGVMECNPLALQVLHVAAHCDAIYNSIVPALKAGRSLVLDRYWWSTWVYGTQAGLDQESLSSLINFERTCWGGVLPAAVVLVDRSEPWRVEESGETWRDLRKIYKDLADQERQLYPVVRTSNEEPIEEVVEELLESLSRISSQKTSIEK